MSYQESHKALKGHLDSTFTLLPSAQQAYQNDPLAKDDRSKRYVVWKMLPAFGAPQSIGGSVVAGNLEREEGIVRAEIYAPPDQMEGPAMEVADAAAAALRKKTIPVAGGSGAIRLGVPRPPIKEGHDEEGWYRVAVEVPYQRDERTAA